MQYMEHKLQEGSNFQLYYLLLNSKRLEQCLALKGEWVNPEGNSRYCVGPVVTWGELWLGRLSILPKIIWEERGGPRMWTTGVGFESPHSRSLHWTRLLGTSRGSSDQSGNSGQKVVFGVMAQLMINIWFLYDHEWKQKRMLKPVKHNFRKT